MKKIILFVFFTTSVVFSQKELWTYSVVNYIPEIDNHDLVRLPIAGDNVVFEVMHRFDPTGPNRNIPRGRPLLASNGKLYGVVCTGDVVPADPTGLLFEYDLILNKYRTVSTSIINSYQSLIEGPGNKLYGICNGGRAIFTYNLITDVTTIVTSIPSFTCFTSYQPLIIDEFILASDGNMYAIANNVKDTNNCAVQNAGILKYNPNTNTFTVPFKFGEGLTVGVYYPHRDPLVEGAPGKLYGTADGGGPQPFINGINPYGSGTLFEYDIYTNILTKKFEFDVNSIGQAPSALVRVASNILYGTLVSHYDHSLGLPNVHGSIFEYNTLTDQLTIKRVIDLNNDLIYNISSQDEGLYASDGNFYFMSEFGIQRYNPITNSIIKKTNALYQWDFHTPIEICRKPSYQEFLPNTYAPAVGTAFTFNVQNTNATTYVWKKGTTVLPGQTTGILNLPNVTAGDTGVYTCTMTNECGTTVTANLNINVSNLGTDTIENYKQQITLYPNPTKGILNLKFPENRGLKASSYKITNLLGQIIEEKDISNSTKTELTINTSSFANGVYQITLVTDKGNWNGKFIKE